MLSFGQLDESRRLRFIHIFGTKKGSLLKRRQLFVRFSWCFDFLFCFIGAKKRPYTQIFKFFQMTKLHNVELHVSSGGQGFGGRNLAGGCPPGGCICLKLNYSQSKSSKMWTHFFSTVFDHFLPFRLSVLCIRLGKRMGQHEMCRVPWPSLFQSKRNHNC